MNGKYVFEKSGSAGSVVNQGTITAGEHAVFIGPQVKNEGTVAAGASTTSVQLASPGQVTLTNTIAAVPLAPGQSQQESIVFPGINCDPDVYEVTATVTADSTNAVDESSETNNSRSRTFAPG
jgi:subtilase family serine protease